MKQHFPYYIILTLLLFQSCSTPKHIHDQSSLERQKELRVSRSGNVFGDVMSGIASVIFGAVIETEIEFDTTERQFKKLNLKNPTGDTIYVNMLTDVYWDENNYCDFMDIRIPPKQNCKVMVPIDANYNLYFSNTPESDDDEMLEIYTSDIKNISLYPGLTILNDTIPN